MKSLRLGIFTLVSFLTLIGVTLLFEARLTDNSSPVLSVSTAQAEDLDEGLYDPVAPDGSAFIRFIQASDKLFEAVPKVDGKKYPMLQFGDSSPYFVIPQGSHSVAFGPYVEKMDIEAGKYHTVAIYEPSKLVIMEDNKNDNRAKSLLSFYNLTQHNSLELKTEDGKVTIIAPLEAGTTNSRLVNALTIKLAIFNSFTKIADLEPVALKRGKAHSVLLLEGARGKVETRIVDNTTDTTR